MNRTFARQTKTAAAIKRMGWTCKAHPRTAPTLQKLLCWDLYVYSPAHTGLQQAHNAVQHALDSLCHLTTLQDLLEVSNWVSCRHLQRQR